MIAFAPAITANPSVPGAAIACAIAPELAHSAAAAQAKLNTLMTVVPLIVNTNGFATRLDIRHTIGLGPLLRNSNTNPISLSFVVHGDGRNRAGDAGQ